MVSNPKLNHTNRSSIKCKGVALCFFPVKWAGALWALARCTCYQKGILHWTYTPSTSRNTHKIPGFVTKQLEQISKLYLDIAINKFIFNEYKFYLSNAVVNFPKKKLYEKIRNITINLLKIRNIFPREFVISEMHKTEWYTKGLSISLWTLLCRN